ncbi:MAG: hypothetical protein JSW39_06805 [Desulfobacterales bacterium]|nr:MAG: hypothetical protein JSW39_06805 [Desulfobacterales bacterium]
MELTCPNCQRSHRIDQARIPVRASAAKCKACGSWMPLSADGAMSSSTPRIKYLKFRCSVCQRRYRLNPTTIPPGTTAVKCKVCGNKISFKSPPAKNRFPQISEQHAAGTQSQTSGANNDPFRIVSEATSKARSLTVPRNRKTSWLLAALAAGIAVAVIGASIALNFPHVKKAKPSLSKKQRSKLISAISSKHETQDSSSSTVKTEPLLVVNLNAPLLLEAIEKNVRQGQAELKDKMVLSVVKSLKFERLEFFLFPDPAHRLLPVLRVESDDRHRLDTLLGRAGVFPNILEPQADGSYRLKTEAFSVSAQLGLPDDFYQVFPHAKGAVLAPKSFSQVLAQGPQALTETDVARLASSATTPQDLAVLAVRVPANIQEEWDRTIKEHPAVKKNPEAAMLADWGGSLLSRVSKSLEHVETLALGFQFTPDDGRQLSYVQQFREGADGAKIYHQLAAGQPDLGKAEGIVRNLIELFQDQRFHHEIQFKNNRLVLQLNWSKKDDQAILSALSEVIRGHLFARNLDLHPSEGPVETRYIREPQFVTEMSVDSVKDRLPVLVEQSIFPGHFWNFGDKPQMNLECDPVDIPNGVLGELTYEVLSVRSPEGQNLRREAANNSRRRIEPGDTASANLALELLAGTPAEALGTAKIRFHLSLPLKLQLLEFGAGETLGTVKESDGVWGKVDRMEKDVAQVQYRGGKSARLFAFDPSGRALATCESVGSAASIAARFQGIIHTLKLVVIQDTLEYPFEVDVDLNRGRELTLARKPETPARVRYDHQPVRNYAGYYEQELEGLEVQWQEESPHTWFDSLSVSLPKGPFRGQAVWEVHFFGESELVHLFGDSFQGASDVCFSLDKGELPKAHAAFGIVQLNLASEITRLSFVRKSGEEPVIQRLPSGEAIEVRFNQNEISLNPGKAQIVQTMAFGNQGRRLKQEGSSNSTGDQRRLYFWGRPEEFVVDLSEKSVGKTIPFDIQKRPLNEIAYTRFKRDIANHREVVKALKAIEAARRRDLSHYGDDVAGLYYLYGRQKDAPLMLIDQDIAHADPAGQARFNYTVKPYKGYYITVLSGTEAHGIKTTYLREAKERTFVWEKGTIITSPSIQLPELVAFPEDKSQPTFVYRWGQVFMKPLNGDQFKYFPEDYHDAGWVEAKFASG